ncbi:efflux RND transporter periplasmic adaptor subunit [Chitinophaga sp. Cy-1792]|uniref:efflux RND transporter periplasmic adaptor subunit n=1 Tax=Chitinophaga sp. Cy-1792 TaxID=2608339 RepID=UPI001424A2E8|nr:efflux RND transporter periplasmic adaptor subunit [Chitinophaga sp. Cy-1792]NIG56215.1 efflux RND transporter periplasmic adaptor subunit [Chitinophaga sp. Cy-1792]
MQTYKSNKHYLALVVLAAGFAACHGTEQKKTPVNHPAKYNMATVVKEPLTSSMQLPGVLQAFEKVSIFPRVNGFVKTITVDRGSKVHKGQLLLELEAPEIMQQYLAAQSKYLQAAALFAASKDNYERMLATSETPGTIAAHDLELSKAKMIADSALMNSERSNLAAVGVMKSYLTVTAPFDGVITERNIHPGALVGPTTKVDDKPMLMLEQEDKLRLVLQVPEILSAQLADGAKVNFNINALPGSSFTGIISRQAGTLSDKYRSEAVEIDVENPKHMLKSGMYAEVSIPVSGSAQAMVVPASAVVMSTERKYVIAVKDHRTKWIDIQEGNHHNDSTEVFGSLIAGDRIITNATDDIKEGTAIE